MISSVQWTQTKTLVPGATFAKKFAAVDSGIGAEVARDMTPQAQQAFIAIGDVTYPIAWQTEKQRKAYFATDGFGKGIPYRRTGGLTRAWEFIWKQMSDGVGGLTLRNLQKAARFVFGGFRPGNGFQQRMHIPNWPNAIAQRNRLFESAKRMRIQKFNETLRGFGTLIFTGRR